MALAKVWNDNEKTYSEQFRDETITIPGKKYVEMDYYDAVAFMGQYVKPIKAGETFVNHKQLRLEMDLTKLVPQTQPKCHVCLGTFKTEDELVMHSEKFHKEKEVQAPQRAGKPELNITTK